MKKSALSLFAAFVAMASAHAQVAFTGTDKPPVDDTPAASTGLNHIYVLHSAAGVGMTYTAQSPTATVTWYSYGSQGGGYATQVEGVARNGSVTTLAQVKADCGYIIEEGTNRTYVWVTDYSAHPLHLTAIEPSSEGDCGTATINLTGEGGDLEYYTITGVRKVLDRQLTLSYNTLTWSDDQNQWQETATQEQFESFKPTMVVPAPLCNTSFTISGDRFQQAWGEGQQLTSSMWTTNAVDVHTTAVQTARDNNDNEKKDDGDTGLGGSAPATITFTAVCTDAVEHHEWQMASDPDFGNIQLRLNQDEVEQTFEEAGTSYWRFIGANSDGSCQAVSETYTVNIGDSQLLCPNVFSPGSTEGVNDVWKVQYKSIVKFNCWIFNRWGIKVATLTDPSQGWDGKYKGKLVDTGVYFYVIDARGADGKTYKLKGDINILRYKKGAGSTSTPAGN